jgi:hypothetical protein
VAPCPLRASSSPCWRLFGDAADSAFDPARPVEPPICVAPDVEEETMTITDPLTAQVADLHGMARDIQSA